MTHTTAHAEATTATVPRPVAPAAARVTAPHCERCDAPLPDMAYLCSRCAAVLRSALLDVPDLVDELATTTARLGRTGSNGAASGAERPLPVDLVAGDVARGLVNTVTTWARYVAEQRGMPLPERLPRPGITGPACRTCGHLTCMVIRTGRPVDPASLAACWLIWHAEWLRHRREVGELVDELDRAVGMARRVIDLPVPHWYAGRCACGADVYARPGAAVLQCRGCGTTWDAAERREWLLDLAADVLGHAEWISRAITALGQPVTAAMIRGYAHRGRLLARGQDRAGRPIYRVGDVLTITGGKPA